MNGLDKFLTTPVDFGFNKWFDQVGEAFNRVKEREAIEPPSGEDIGDYWEMFFEPLILKLSVAGGNLTKSGGCEPSFAALVVSRRWDLFKRTVLPYLMH